MNIIQSSGVQKEFFKYFHVYEHFSDSFGI